MKTNRAALSLFVLASIAAYRATAASSAHSISDPLFESDAVIPDLKDEAQRIELLQLAHAAAYTVRTATYKCDTVSSLLPMVLHRGFEMKCNKYAYDYEFHDIGGHWEIMIEGRLIATNILDPPAPPPPPPPPLTPEEERRATEAAEQRVKDIAEARYMELSREYRGYLLDTPFLARLNPAICREKLMEMGWSYGLAIAACNHGDSVTACTETLEGSSVYPAATSEDQALFRAGGGGNACARVHDLTRLPK